MNRSFGRTVACLILFLVATCCGVSADEQRCTRIVSLAPSITEILFDLGLGDRLVGVTRFCRYPPAAQKIPKVGGFYDVSLEQIVAQRATQVFVLSESARALEPLARLGIAVDVLDHTRVRGIQDSYIEVGRKCGIASLAEARVAQLRMLGEQVRARCLRAPILHGKRALVVVGRTREGNESTGVYVSGRDGFYSDLLELVGATNVNTRSTVAIPTLSSEGILKLNPDIILEIVNTDDGELSPTYMSFWKNFPTVSAIRHNRVFLLSDDMASIPGPRYINLAQKLSDLLCGS